MTAARVCGSIRPGSGFDAKARCEAGCEAGRCPKIVRRAGRGFDGAREARRRGAAR